MTPDIELTGPDRRRRRRRRNEDTKSPHPYSHHVRGALSIERNPYGTRYVAQLIRLIDSGRWKDE